MSKKTGNFKRGRGKPPTVIDRDELFRLAQTMLPIQSIADFYGCSRETLYANYSDILRRAREARKQALSMIIWEKALIEKNTTMLIWLSKQHLGYRESPPEESAKINFHIYTSEIPVENNE